MVGPLGRRDQEDSLSVRGWRGSEKRRGSEVVEGGEEEEKTHVIGKRCSRVVMDLRDPNNTPAHISQRTLLRAHSHISFGQKDFKTYIFKCVVPNFMVTERQAAR